MLAIGRALMAQPIGPAPRRAVDGPLAHPDRADLRDHREINAQGTTVLLVEQNALMALNVAHRGYVLQTGQIILADTAANLAANEQVRQAYLGEI